MAAKKHDSKKPATTQITEVLRVTEGRLEACIVGMTPFIANKMSNKGLHELLFPGGGRREGLKHDPLKEFRGSPYTFSHPNAPTLLAHVVTAFKGGMRNAAIDMPGMKKAQVGRLVWVCEQLTAMYGVPKLGMHVVRSADMARTPDVRTRAIIPEWACRIHITFAEQLIRPQAVVNLLSTAGLTQGVGDWRPEKGSGNFGRFRLTDANDPDFKRIVREGGRKQQLAAMEADTPEFFDPDSAELYGWFVEERKRRELKGVA
jgi:hypothetical protein